MYSAERTGDNSYVLEEEFKLMDCFHRVDCLLMIQGLRISGVEDSLWIELGARDEDEGKVGSAQRTRCKSCLWKDPDEDSYGVECFVCIVEVVVGEKTAEVGMDVGKLVG